MKIAQYEFVCMVYDDDDSVVGKRRMKVCHMELELKWNAVLFGITNVIAGKNL